MTSIPKGILPSAADGCPLGRAACGHFLTARSERMSTRQPTASLLRSLGAKATYRFVYRCRARPPSC